MVGSVEKAKHPWDPMGPVFCLEGDGVCLSICILTPGESNGTYIYIYVERHLLNRGLVAIDADRNSGLCCYCH